jgi:hypothetical protein
MCRREAIFTWASRHKEKRWRTAGLDLAKQLEAVSPVQRRTGASGGLQVGRILIAVTGKKGVRHQVPTRVLCLDDKA